jgi:hypothetical protein
VTRSPVAQLTEALDATGAVIEAIGEEQWSLPTCCPEWNVADLFDHRQVPGSVAVQLRIAEILVHGWDLAWATGQPARFPEELAESSLAFSKPALAGLPPGRHPFAPPQPVPDCAPAIDRLAACLGRKVSAAGPTS